MVGGHRQDVKPLRRTSGKASRATRPCRTPSLRGPGHSCDPTRPMDPASSATAPSRPHNSRAISPVTGASCGRPISASAVLRSSAERTWRNGAWLSRAASAPSLGSHAPAAPSRSAAMTPEAALQASEGERRRPGGDGAALRSSPPTTSVVGAAAIAASTKATGAMSRYPLFGIVSRILGARASSSSARRSSANHGAVLDNCRCHSRHGTATGIVQRSASALTGSARARGSRAAGGRARSPRCGRAGRSGGPRHGRLGRRRPTRRSSPSLQSRASGTSRPPATRSEASRSDPPAMRAARARRPPGRPRRPGR